MVRVASPIGPMAARKRLQDQRGAAVFIVVMVLTLLAAVGIFAVRSASLADAAAGYDREGAQASLIAQYGIAATSAYLGTGVAGTIIQAMKPTSNTAYIAPKCASNAWPLAPLPPPSPTPPIPPSCFSISQDALQTSFTASSNETLFAPSNAAVPLASHTSSLNANETTSAAFAVELTEARSTGMPPQGTQSDLLVLYQITLTSLAQVTPVEACINGLPTPNAAQTAVRATITVGGPP
jgi:hypothetical protein